MAAQPLNIPTSFPRSVEEIGLFLTTFITALNTWAMTVDIDPSFTVAKLPTNAVLGQKAVVTDGTAALAWGATVTGGGATKYLVWWNGANWTVLGK